MTTIADPAVPTTAGAPSLVTALPTPGCVSCRRRARALAADRLPGSGSLGGSDQAGEPPRTAGAMAATATRGDGDRRIDRRLVLLMLLAGAVLFLLGAAIGGGLT